MTKLFTDPNKYAKQTYRRIGEGMKAVYKVGGYHTFEISKINEKLHLVIGAETQIKERLIRDYDYEGKTVLDLGCNSGALSFMALRSGAEEVVGVDIDKDCCKLIKDVIHSYDISNFNLLEMNVKDITDRKFDYVFAFALVHWIYSCTAAFGSLGKVMNWLSVRTKERCFVEWIDPEDSAISFFKHTGYNPENQLEPYTFDRFMSAGRKHFKTFEVVGGVRAPTRTLYCGSNL